MRRWLPIALAAAATHPARADGVVEELSAGTASGSRWVSNQLAGMWDVDPAWQLRLDLSATRAGGSATGETYIGSLSAVFSPDPHWSLRFNGGWSPEVASDVTVQVPIGGGVNPDAQLHATASWVVLGAGVDYSSASSDMHSVSASLAVGETYFRTHQEVVGVQDWTSPGSGKLSAADAVLRCQTVMCAPNVSGMLLPQMAELGQFALNASITDTVDGDTDLSLGASYYLYGDDPGRPGYFALSTLAAGTRASATSAPLLRAGLAPSVTHRWGALSTTLGLAYTRNASRREFDASAALSIQYGIALTAPRRLMLDARLEADAHGYTTDRPTPAGSAALGMQYIW
ncbi:MAG TPA: hypothetical protein VHT91_31520 [Kofleriaceae bacterium]|jgi:hypothetical protein|nr:hypothetical protein [Kofleriaceae bacterium]